VSSQSVSDGGSKRTLVIVLAIIAVIALVLGILWLTGSAPSFLDSGSHVKSGNHLLRGAVALVVGIACAAGAWWTSKKP
jgi:uncharacterized membrane protein YidH (DUF202 family)